MNIDYKAIEDHLNKQVCPIHDVHPVAIHDGEEMKLTVCCDAFRATLVEDTKNSLKELLLNRARNSFN